jgi:hypothetical protein
MSQESKGGGCGVMALGILAGAFLGFLIALGVGPALVVDPKLKADLGSAFTMLYCVIPGFTIGGAILGGILVRLCLRSSETDDDA